jgi:septal ring factor EnvC (AmiA/AmiB activator)
VTRPEAFVNRPGATFFAALLVVCLTLPCPGLAQQNPGRDDAESKLGQVLKEIGQLQRKLESSRTELKKEQAQLRTLDLAIQQANLEFRKLEQQRLGHLDELQNLESQREDYLSSLEQRMDRLAEQVRTSYRSGRQSRMKLVLNQDDPVRLGRMLAYYDYLNRAQAGKISLLKEALATLDTMRQSIDRELLRLSEVQTMQQEILNELNGQREKRQTLLAALAGQIDTEQSRLKELERNRQDLEALIERLSNALADIPADLGSHVGITGQKGRLLMPLKGPVRHAFGQSRGGGLRWQGWLIAAETGAEASAIAYGRVAFADWLRGYGLLIIIDHGQGYMSLYGHNESLLHEVGAWVEPGEAISVVGNNPGSGQGLYFELRKQGKAVDPAAWLKR